MCYVFHGIVFFHILAPYILSGKLTSLCPPFYSWVNQLFQNGAIFYSKLSGMVIHGGFLKWGYSQILPNRTIFSIEIHGFGVPLFWETSTSTSIPQSDFWHFPCLELQKAQLLASKECQGHHFLELKQGV